MEPHCFLFMDETAHGYTFLNVGTLQELEEAGRQRFAKCTVLPAVYFGEKTRATPQVCRERRDRGEGRRAWGVYASGCITSAAGPWISNTHY